MVLGVSTVGCGATPAPEAPSASEPTPTEGTSVVPPEGTTSSSSAQDELVVGERTDGATLTAVEVLETKEGASLVLSFDGAGRPPVTRSRVENQKLVVLIVEGVRGVTADVPVVTGEGGQKLREPRAIGRGPVVSLGRGFYGDDSGIRIDVELSSLPALELVEGSKGRSVELRMKPQ